MNFEFVVCSDRQRHGRFYGGKSVHSHNVCDSCKPIEDCIQLSAYGLCMYFVFRTQLSTDFRRRTILILQQLPQSIRLDNIIRHKSVGGGLTNVEKKGQLI